ncbi:MAG: hypothetical protein ACYTXE_36940 [Nostoc sp.]
MNRLNAITCKVCQRKNKHSDLIGSATLSFNFDHIIGSWQLLVILVGVRQKADGRGQKEEEGKIPIIEALLGL